MSERKTKNRQSNRDETIRYLISKSGGEDLIVEVPAHWKVTFGYVNPERSKDGYARGDGHAVRMYEGEKLRLVIGNSTGLRDLSIPLAKKFSKESGQSTWSRDSEGNFKDENTRQIEAGYVIEEEDDPFGG
jgi:hypothetical protein